MGTDNTSVATRLSRFQDLDVMFADMNAERVDAVVEWIVDRVDDGDESREAPSVSAFGSSL